MKGGMRVNHIKDLAFDDNGWYFIQIGKGTIDYQEVLKELAVLSESVPISLKVPLRIKRAPDASPRRAPRSVDLAEIRRVMTGSVNFVKQLLSA